MQLDSLIRFVRSGGIEIDRTALLRDRSLGLSLAQLAKAYKISRTSVARALKQSEGAVPKTPFPAPQPTMNASHSAPCLR